MKMLSGVLALCVAIVPSNFFHQHLPTPIAAVVDLLVFIAAYIVISRAIKSYLDD